MSLQTFKERNKGKFFILKLSEAGQPLLQFDGVVDMKNYIFADESSKQVLYRELPVFTEGLDKELDPDQIEALMASTTDKFLLFSVILDDCKHHIVIDVDELDDSYWQELNNAQDALYQGNTEAFAKIQELLTGE